MIRGGPGAGHAIKGVPIGRADVVSERFVIVVVETSLVIATGAVFIQSGGEEACRDRDSTEEDRR
jgi:hypothetical protein